MHTRQLSIYRAAQPDSQVLDRPPFTSTVSERRTFSPKHDIYIGSELVVLPICAEEHTEKPNNLTHEGDFPVVLNFVGETTYAAMMEEHAHRYHHDKPIQKDASVWRYRRKER
jgi:hypothetical protein